MKNQEFVISMEVEHGASNRLNHTDTVSPRTGIEIQQEVTCSKQEDNTFTERRKKSGKQELQKNHATRRARIRTRKIILAYQTLSMLHV